jgi:hypothetical protein
MKTKKQELLELLARHTGIVTSRSAHRHEFLPVEMLERQVSGDWLPDEVWAAGFDHWRAEP